jgi:hypothetical protein
MNEEQINQLKELQFNPQLVVLFEEPDESVVEKLEKRSIDPATGTFYESENGQTMKNSELGEDHKQMCAQIVGEHRNFVGLATEEYGPQMIRINAQADPDLIYLNFCDAIQSAI